VEEGSFVDRFFGTVNPEIVHARNTAICVIVTDPS